MNSFLNRKFIFTILVLSSAFFGCAKDRNLDEYKNENANMQFTKFKSAEGNYTGVMTSAEGKSIGAIQINFSAVMEPQPSTDGTAGTAAPRLASDITFYDGTNTIRLATSKSTFNSDTRLFTGSIDITRSSGKIESLDIQASISGGQVTGGVIKSKNSASYATHFNLKKDGESIESISAKVLTKDSTPNPDFVQLSSYLGQTKFSNSQVRPVHIIILQPRHGTEEDFLNLVVPTKSVVVSLNYGSSPSVQFKHTDAILDTSSNTLSGQTQIGGVLSTNQNPSSSGGMQAPAAPSNSVSSSAAVTFLLQCKLSKGDKSLECDHLTSSGRGSAAHTSAVIDTKNSPDPSDRTQGLEADRRTFHGHAIENGKVTKYDLELTYPARSHAQDISNLFVGEAPEKSLYVALGLGLEIGDPFYITFLQATWDTNTQSLDAKTYVGPELNLSTLVCQNFDFYKTTTATTCDYAVKTKRAHIQFTNQSGK